MRDLHLHASRQAILLRTWGKLGKIGVNMIPIRQKTAHKHLVCHHGCLIRACRTIRLTCRQQDFLSSASSLILQGFFLGYNEHAGFHLFTEPRWLAACWLFREESE